MKKLVHKLLTIRVRPYYIYQCDLSRGISHFRTSVAKGIEIIETCAATPRAWPSRPSSSTRPGGGGKIPVMPNYLITRWPRGRRRPAQLRGRHHHLHVAAGRADPRTRRARPRGTTRSYRAKDGVAMLLSGDKRCIEPSDLIRHKRNDD